MIIKTYKKLKTKLKKQNFFLCTTYFNKKKIKLT